MTTTIERSFGGILPGYKDLIVWQKANELAIEIYRLSKDFPDDERYGLTSQIRRAAVSVPTNIVEGNAKLSSADFVRFLDIARGSLAETEYLLFLANNLGFVKKDKKIASELISQVGKLIWSLRASLSKKDKSL